VAGWLGDRPLPALAICQDLPAAELRSLARHEPDRRAAMRRLAIAHALDGFSRAEAARLAGMEALTPGQQQAALKAWVLRGPNPERDKVSAWRLVDICARAEQA
jgi:hypothetical protein